MTRLIVASGLMTILLLLGACQTEAPPLRGRLDPYQPSQVHFTSERLEADTRVGVPIATRDEVGRILYITVPIRSVVNEQMAIDYRVTFFDEHGQQISQTSWLSKYLAPRVPDQILVNSMTDRAADFQVDLRPAQ